MIVRIVLPELETNVVRSAVQKWHVHEGDAIAFGDRICDLSVVDRMLPDTAGASAFEYLSKRTRRKRRRTTKGTFELTYSVIASEAGQLRSIEAPTGTEVMAGHILGTALVGSDEDVDAVDLEAAPELRTIAKVLEPDQP